jgi:hypothetical protein
MSSRQLLVFGGTRSGKTALVCTGLWDNIGRLPGINTSGMDHKIMKNYQSLKQNRPIDGTAATVDCKVLLTGDQGVWQIRDMKGGDVHDHGKSFPLLEEAAGVLFVVAWESVNFNSRMDVIQTHFQAVSQNSSLWIGLAITKSERAIAANDTAWECESNHNWWHGRQPWSNYQELLQKFGQRIWVTSSFGYDIDQRPACILDEFGQMIPYGVQPRNVWMPFANFLRGREWSAHDR